MHAVQYIYACSMREGVMKAVMKATSVKGRRLQWVVLGATMSVLGLLAVFAFEHVFLKLNPPTDGNHDREPEESGETEEPSP